MELIFIYNADSGALNLLKDGLHKLFRPRSYPCKLCQLTYGALAEKQRWKAFCKSRSGEMRFLHKDEFEAEFKDRFQYPVVVEPCAGHDDKDAFSIVLSHEDLGRLDDVDDLIRALSA